MYLVLYRLLLVTIFIFCMYNYVCLILETMWGISSLEHCLPTAVEYISYSHQYLIHTNCCQNVYSSNTNGHENWICTHINCCENCICTQMKTVSTPTPIAVKTISKPTPIAVKTVSIPT